MKFLLFSCALFLFLVTSYLFPISVLAQGTDWLSLGFKLKTVCVFGLTDVPTIQGFECLFANVLKVIVTVAGLAFLIMFIVGGFQYMQSSSDPKAVAAASSTLTYAIIGLVGAIVSFLIIVFIQQFTGINIIDFKVPV